ncbi:MAG TPA: hydroxymethylbilane synthase, partial [Bacteroidales bacterium]
ERAEFCDALVSRTGKKFLELDETDIIATSSLRRKAQLLHINPKLKIVDIRGNVDTRLHKMNDGYCTAMIMASAGLQRLGYHNIITEIINPEVIIPAVSQGAIAIEIREADSAIGALIDKINHQPTLLAVEAERVFLRSLEGGCQVPIGCYSSVAGDRYKITGFVSDLDGSAMLKDSLEGKLSEANEIARKLAEDFCSKGALEIIQKIRSVNNV